MAEDANPTNEQLAIVFATYESFVESIVKHLDQLEAERAAAEASGDPRYVYRVERGITWSNELLDALDEQVAERIFSLRHNAHQLGYAREGKIV